VRSARPSSQDLTERTEGRLRVKLRLDDRTLEVLVEAIFNRDRTESLTRTQSLYGSDLPQPPRRHVSVAYHFSRIGCRFRDTLSSHTFNEAGAVIRATS